VILIHQRTTDRHTDGQTDGRTTCNDAISIPCYALVHRTVKTTNRFLRNRRLILRLHTISRALIYWAHRAVVRAIAWHIVKRMLIRYLTSSRHGHIVSNRIVARQ